MKTSSPAVLEVIQNYFEGYTEAESVKLLRAFHPETQLLSVDAGKLEKTEMSEWLLNIERRKAAGDIRTGKFEILNSEEFGEAAVATVVMTFPKLEFTDHLSLLRVDGAFKIVGKTYTVRPL